MPRYYIVILAPLMMLTTVYFMIINPIMHDARFKYYKLYKREYATTVIVVDRRLSPFECFKLQLDNNGTVCRRAQ
jgi:hypothetical protein